MFLRPTKIYFTSEDILFITSSPLCLLRVFTSYLNFGSCERPPQGGALLTSVSSLKIMSFFIFDVSLHIFFFKKIYFENGLKIGRLYILYRYCKANCYYFQHASQPHQADTTVICKCGLMTSRCYMPIHE